MAKGIILDENSDLAIANGMVVGETDQQNVEALLVAHPGDLKEAPLSGVGLSSWLNAPFSPINRIKLERSILIQLQSDGAVGISAEIQDKASIDINAKYND